MNSFLENIAQNIYQDYKNELEQVCVVFPNQRAGVYFKKYLGELSELPVFSPKICTLDEFVSEYAGLQSEEPIHLLFDLFKIHQQIEKEKAFSFNDFFSFGEMMIHDFSEIDLYLVNPKTVFTWLNDEKAMSFWNPEGKPLTEFQKKYLLFYNSLYTYYTFFQESLLKERKAYTGMIFRNVAENIEQVEKNISYKKIFFCGFNALSKSEYTIFRYLERAGKATIFWDSDIYYMDSEIQEAGFFLRKYQSEFKNFTEPNDFFHQQKEIYIIGTPENVLQAKVAGNILQNLSKKNGLKSTALVLADENLLIPALNSIPNEVEDINITMGYPFLQTPIHNLINSIFELHIQKEKSGNKKYYYPFIEQILQNDLLKKALDFQLGSSLTEKAEEIGKSYWSISDIEWVCQTLFIDYNKIDFIFAPILQSSDIFQKIKSLLTFFIESNIEHYLSEEYFLGLREIIKCLDKIEDNLLQGTDLKTFFKIYKNYAKGIKIPFYGEPLKGLQMMGMLETRCIDFERVILLSTNEGFLPSGKTQNSLLPFKIKQHFEIPTYQDRDAIFAYHFYKLIQRAKEIYLVYHTDSDGFSKGEKSRFIKQLQYELPQYSNNAKIQEDYYVASFSAATIQEEISIKKDEQTINILKQRSNFPGFSPSALNTYCNCSLRFYYLYVLKVKEEKPLSEEITMDVFGSASHEVLEKIFTEIKNTSSDSESQIKIIETYFPLIEDMFLASLKKVFRNEVNSGKNKLIVTVAVEQLKTFLKNQIEFLKKHQVEIIDLEKDLKGSVFVPGLNQFINLSGFADRIDTVDGVLRIIDYKTGKVNPTDLKASEQTLSIENSKEKWFQLMMYAYLLDKENKYPLPFISGIYSLRQYESNLLPASFNKNEFIDPQLLQEFDRFLIELISEIFDTSKEFIQTQKKEHCRYCQFAPLCGK